VLLASLETLVHFDLMCSKFQEISVLLPLPRKVNGNSGEAVECKNRPPDSVGTLYNIYWISLTHSISNYFLVPSRVK